MRTRGVRGIVAMALLSAASGWGAGCADEACEALDGADFVSVSQHECGLGPDGPVMCPWGISFQGDRFTWNYSDVVEEGSYACEEGAITATNAGWSYTGSYDPDRGVLTWDGIEYAQQ